MKYFLFHLMSHIFVQFQVNYSIFIVTDQLYFFYFFIQQTLCWNVNPGKQWSEVMSHISGISGNFEDAECVFILASVYRPLYIQSTINMWLCDILGVKLVEMEVMLAEIPKQGKLIRSSNEFWHSSLSLV